jgi:prevent-host-death family protein
MTGVTELRNNYPQLLKKLRKGPVVLAQRSKAVAVIVTPELWDAQADELARLRRIIEADKHFAEMAAGNYVDLQDLDKALAAA